MLNFQWPWLFTLLPLPLLIWLLWRPLQTQQFVAITVPFYQRLKESNIEHHQQSPATWLCRLAMIACWILLVLAAARPQWIGDAIKLPTQGRDLMLAIDVSESMKIADLELRGERTDRLSVLKQVMGRFILRRQEDRIGLILFGSQAFLHAPLTFDHETVNQFLQESAIGLAGPNTAIGDAIGLAIQRLKDRPVSSRVLILITDGANTAGNIEPLQAAELAEKSQLKVYTIGVGASELIIDRGFGFGQRRVNPSADLDEATLTAIAEQTGGQYFRAADTNQLKEIYELLDELEPSEEDPEILRPQKSLIHWPLSLALLLSIFISFRQRQT